MKEYRYTVTQNQAGERLDKYIVAAMPKEISRTRIQGFIDEGGVLVNGAASKRHHKVSAGDMIHVKVPSRAPSELKAQRIPIDIVYEDDRMIVVNKSAGMVVHPAPGNYDGTLVNALLYHSKRLSRQTEERPGIVHRLDKDTSGLIVIDKDEAAHAYIGRQFSRRHVSKSYVAVVEGLMRVDNGVIDAAMGRHRFQRQKMAVIREEGEGRPAVTSYKVLKRFKAHTLVEFSPQTGRTHQIRVHAAHIGHPVVGDASYGKRAAGLIGRHALHAARITFRHPQSRQAVTFESQLPKDMKMLIKALDTK